MKAKILSVDDNPANLIVVRRLLSRLDDIELIEARTGNEALAATLDHDFALILLDVYMPDMDGFEVASFLAQEQRSRNTPVIFVTATYADDLHRMKGYRFGAVDYITKPLDERILLSKVQVFLELHRSRAALNRAIEDLAERERQLEREIAERKRAESEVMHLATHDVLTGLPNRRLFIERGEAAVLAASGTSQRVGLICMSFSRFKWINDRYGHQTGDRVLVVAAKRLLALVGPGDCVARVGGDEFAVLVSDSGTEQLDVLAGRLAEALCAPIDVSWLPAHQGHQIDPDVAIGIAAYPDQGGSFDDVIRAAGRQMLPHQRSSGRAGQG